MIILCNKSFVTRYFYKGKDIKMNYDFFISYCREDEFSAAFPLFHILSNLGFDVWMDRDNIMPGDEIYETIKLALRTSSGVIAVIAEPYLTRDWTIEELKITLELENNGERQILLPIFHNLAPETVWSHFPCLKGRAFEPVSTVVIDYSSEEITTAIDRIVNWYFMQRLAGGIKDENWNWIYRYTTKAHINQLICLLEFCCIPQADIHTSLIGYTNAILYAYAILTELSPICQEDRLYTIALRYCRHATTVAFQLQKTPSDHMLLTSKTILFVLLKQLKASLDVA